MSVAVGTAGLLKGEAFARRVAAICEEQPAPEPIDDLRYARILTPALWGGETTFALVGFILQALRMRGARIECLLCDAMLPACTARKADHVESACTRWCHRNAAPMARAMRLPHRWYSELITPDEVRECRRAAARLRRNDLPDLELRGIALGTHLLRSLESYYKLCEVDLDDPDVLAQARAFADAAMELTIIAFRALREGGVDKVFMEDGQKTDWGVFRSVARHLGIPVDVMHLGLRGTSLRFETDRPPAPTARIPQWPRWKQRPLTADQDAALDDYLQRRATVPCDYVGPEWQTGVTDLQQIRAISGLPAQTDGLAFALYPNVGFDVARTSTAPAYATAIDWVQDTVRFFRAHPRHHLIIKAHPAEHHRQAADPILDLLRERGGVLPGNVHVISPDAGVSAQSVARLADVALVYTSTVAVEAAAIGCPVVLVGGGWNAGRGFTHDVGTPAAYRRLLEDVSAGRRTLDPHTELARRFAYAQFFRVDVPVSHFRFRGSVVADLPLRSLGTLAPGADPSIDAVCRGILCDAPFENPEADLVERGLACHLTAC